MKGWITLHVLCYNDVDEDSEKLRDLGITIKDKEETIFRKCLFQISNIAGIDLEFGEIEHDKMKGNAYIHTNGGTIEVKETPKEILDLIKIDKLII